jgi:hypothetical protein
MSDVPRGGAPRKHPDGLQKVLYVRVSSELSERLNAYVDQWRRETPGISVSVADVVRNILWREMESDEG